MKTTKVRLTPRGELVMNIAIVIALVAAFALGLSPWVWDHVPWAVR